MPFQHESIFTYCAFWIKKETQSRDCKKWLIILSRQNVVINCLPTHVCLISISEWHNSKKKNPITRKQAKRLGQNIDISKCMTKQNVKNKANTKEAPFSIFNLIYMYSSFFWLKFLFNGHKNINHVSILTCGTFWTCALEMYSVEKYKPFYCYLYLTVYIA